MFKNFFVSVGRSFATKQKQVIPAAIKPTAGRKPSGTQVKLKAAAKQAVQIDFTQRNIKNPKRIGKIPKVLKSERVPFKLRVAKVPPKPPKKKFGWIRVPRKLFKSTITFVETKAKDERRASPSRVTEMKSTKKLVHPYTSRIPGANRSLIEEAYRCSRPSGTPTNEITTKLHKLLLSPEAKLMKPFQLCSAFYYLVKTNDKSMAKRLLVLMDKEIEGFTVFQLANILVGGAKLGFGERMGIFENEFAKSHLDVIDPPMLKEIARNYYSLKLRNRIEKAIVRKVKKIEVARLKWSQTTG